MIEKKVLRGMNPALVNISWTIDDAISTLQLVINTSENKKNVDDAKLILEDISTKL